MASGELANAGAVDAIGVSATALGASCAPPVGDGVIVICSVDVCVPLLLLLLLLLLTFLSDGEPSVAAVVIAMLVVVPLLFLFC